MAALYLDITKSRKQTHHSGLRRMRAGLERGFQTISPKPVRLCRWSYLRATYVDALTGERISSKTDDFFLTPEIFALSERPLSQIWLKRYGGISASIYYDAIPFTRPDITWPRSVRRFLPWLKGLASYRQLFYISQAAKEEAKGIAQRLRIPLPEGSVISLGADYIAESLPRLSFEERLQETPILLSTGIVEPRKGYPELLAAAERLWKKGRLFKLVILGRVNPWFGDPIVAEIKRLQHLGRDLVHETEADDARLSYWHQRASLVVQASHAEGFGLPVVEALWAGCPVLCSTQPVLECIANNDAVILLGEIMPKEIEERVERLLEEPVVLSRMEAAIDRETLPTWKKTAVGIQEVFSRGHL